jgi:hypothetical protein
MYKFTVKKNLDNTRRRVIVYNQKTYMPNINRIGNLDYLKSVSSKIPKSKWTDIALNILIKNGNLDCLKFALAQGCQKTFKICNFAAKYGRLDCLKYARDNGYPLHITTVNNAIQFGQINCLEYIYDSGMRDDKILDTAAFYGNIDSIKFARKRGEEWSVSVTRIAASSGKLDCLKYLHENGCPWDEETCSDAATRYIECLKYAHENGCPWEETTCIQAAIHGNIECLKYAHQNGCPLGNDVCRVTDYSYSTKRCIMYAYLMGSVWYDAPEHMVLWKNRIRTTAQMIMDTWRFKRNHAARVIQHALLEVIYRPDKPIVKRQMLRFFKEQEKLS